MPAVADASLSTDERRLLERFVAELLDSLGKDLWAVWLFGSRARGEPVGAESDIDLLVLAADASWDSKERIHGALARAVDALLGVPRGVGGEDQQIDVGLRAYRLTACARAEQPHGPQILPEGVEKLRDEPLEQATLVGA